MVERCPDKTEVEGSIPSTRIEQLLIGRVAELVYAYASGAYPL